MTHRPSGLLAAVALVAALGGCVTPATGVDSYRGKASMTIEAAISEVESTGMAVQSLLDDRIFTPYTDEVISANESALGSIGDAFGSVQPPPGADRLRMEVSALVSDAEDAVATARIAARRRDRTALAEALRALVDVAAQLEARKRD